MKNKIKTVVSLSLVLSCVNSTFAGTTQIYSPSGLSPNTYQNAGPPVAVPTLSAPSSSTPLEFAPADSPLPNSSPARPSSSSSSAGVQDSILNGAWPGQPQNNSVESFFQLKAKPSLSPSPLPPSEAALQAKSAATSKNESSLGGIGRLIWHTLDNVGIPMFVGKDNDLDPSLRNDYVPLSNSNKDHSSKNSSNRTVSTSGTFERIIPHNSESPPQKIPQSELEGIEVSPKNDSRISTP
jgi:hypothetical protein